MRSLLAIPAAALVLAAFLPADSEVVTVHATCDGAKLGAHSVTPETVTLAQDQDIDWELDDASTATDLSIVPKQAGHWPYANAENFHGGHGHAHRAHGDGKHMNKKADGTYQYSIDLSCPDGQGGSHAVTIDPTIIVHGG